MKVSLSEAIWMQLKNKRKGEGDTDCFAGGEPRAPNIFATQSPMQISGQMTGINNKVKVVGNFNFPNINWDCFNMKANPN